MICLLIFFVVVGRWKEVIYIAFKKCSFWSKTLVVTLETFPGHFMNDISNSYNASSKATWTSTILPGNCKEWDLYWPWLLRKLANHCKKQRPRPWTCHPSISWVSAMPACQGGICAQRSHSTDCSLDYEERKLHGIDPLPLPLSRYFLVLNLSQTCLKQKIKVKNIGDHQYPRYKGNNENTVLNRYLKLNIIICISL